MIDFKDELNGLPLGDIILASFRIHDNVIRTHHLLHPRIRLELEKYLEWGKIEKPNTDLNVMISITEKENLKKDNE